MKQKRTYLTVPGQDVRITIEGDAGADQDRLATKLVEMFRAEGLFSVQGLIGMANVVTATCPTPAESQELYLDTLDEHQRATLRGHLDALGYEL